MNCKHWGVTLAGGLLAAGQVMVVWFLGTRGAGSSANLQTLIAGLAYAVANAIFGGSAEYVALGLKSMGMENTFYWYVTGMMAVAFLFSLRLPKQAEYLHHDL